MGPRNIRVPTLVRKGCETNARDSFVTTSLHEFALPCGMRENAKGTGRRVRARNHQRARD
eukprot:11901371-Alexandrium_andersonii.AAC.1